MLECISFFKNQRCISEVEFSTVSAQIACYPGRHVEILYQFNLGFVAAVFVSFFFCPLTK